MWALRRNLILLITGFLTFLAIPVAAQLAGTDTSPGDSCAGFPAGATRMTADADQDGAKITLICDGATWQPDINEDADWQIDAVNNYIYNTSDDVGINTATPKAPLHVGGEAIVGNTGLTCDSDRKGGLRWNESSLTIQICDGTGWKEISVTACDISPAFFTFTDQSSLGKSVQVTSNIVLVTGLDAGCNTQVSVNGDGSPEYRVCSASDCSTEVQTWTASNMTFDMEGKYLQLRATTAGTDGATNTVDMTVGAGSTNWNITTTDPDACNSVGPGDEGTICADGSVYAGTSPAGGAMFITRCDLGQDWDGSICSGTRYYAAWNDDQFGKWVNTSLANCGSPGTCDADGKSNTATLVTEDSSTDSGTQPHIAAQECTNLVKHGHSDWYLPSTRELDVIYENLIDGVPNDNVPDPVISGFDANDRYWSSSEVNATYSWLLRLVNKNWVNEYKYSDWDIRCARR